LVERAASSGADLVVLPELIDMGYDLATVAARARTTVCSQFTAGLQREAWTRSLWMVAGVTEVHDGRLYDSAVVISSEGKVVGSYRKAHLFQPTGEDRAFARGAELVVVECLGTRIGLAICYDLRFPELFRALAIAGSTVVAVVSAFPLERLDHWQTLLQARALDNQVFVAAANRVGVDAGIAFCGASAVVDPTGVPAPQADTTSEDVLVVSLDLSLVDRFRAEIPVHESRREDLCAARVRVI
jgi:predicted amidohydrolase